jgi:(p)ppGpp synthase/HD superfamily hydrolase
MGRMYVVFGAGMYVFLKRGGAEEGTLSTKEVVSSRFDNAFVFASRLHADQVRKGTRIPYIAHLMSVAAIVLEHGGDEDEVIAALLHDAVEDRGGQATRDEISARFGERVARIVDGCTDAIPDSDGGKGEWGPRKQAYIAHLAEAEPSVLLVSTADKLHNARAILGDYRDIGEKLWERFNGKKDGTLWYYKALAKAFQASGKHARLVAELDRTVEELHKLAGAD